MTTTLSLCMLALLCLLSVAFATVQSVDDNEHQAIVSELLELLPQEHESLIETQAKLLQEVHDTKNRIRQINNKHESHVDARFRSFERQRQRLMNEIQQNSHRLAQLNRETVDELDNPPQLIPKYDPQVRIMGDNGATSTSSESSSQPLKPGVVEAEQVSTTTATTTSDSSSTSAPSSSISNSASSSSSNSGSSTSSSSQSGSGSSSNSGSSGSGNSDTIDDDNTIHRFNGVPHRMQFHLGNSGYMDCTCRYVESGLGCPFGAASGGSFDPSRPWIPASSAVNPELAQANCYENCQEFKCSKIFLDKGFDEWHECVNSCVERCYHRKITGSESSNSNSASSSSSDSESSIASSSSASTSSSSTSSSDSSVDLSSNGSF